MKTDQALCNPNAFSLLTNQYANNTIGHYMMIRFKIFNSLIPHTFGLLCFVLHVGLHPIFAVVLCSDTKKNNMRVRF